MKKVLAAMALSLSFNSSAQTQQTVPEVDLNRYIGRWYEIASYPNYFQRRCASNVTAEYAVRDDAKVSVINRCLTAENKEIEAKGWAKVVPETGNAQLKVTFLWPFFGDYWIIGLDPQYRYAVVGNPERDNLWILSRSPQMEPDLLNSALETARAQGYDLSRLRYTKQSAAKLAPAPMEPEQTETPRPDAAASQSE